MPLLEGLDGVNKMSKSLGNYIGITEAADDIYGKVLSISDELMFRYYELLSDLSNNEIEDLRTGSETRSLHPKSVKQQLAREFTARFQSGAAAPPAEENFEKVFEKEGLPDDLPERCHAAEPIWVPQLLVDAGLVPSTSEGRRLIKQNAVSINGEKITDSNYAVQPVGDLVFKVGKSRFCKVIFS